MKCPYCGEEMELGYIQCRDGVTWVKEPSLVAALSSLNRTALVLASGGGGFSGAAAEAHKCSQCKKIVIDYSRKMEW